MYNSAYAFQNEPDGFRGIAWESVLTQYTKPSQGYYVNINSLQAKQQYPEILFYNPSDTLQLGESKVTSLTYYSYQKNERTPPVFSKVNLYFEGENNVKILESFLLETFGKPTENNTFIKDNNNLGTWELMFWKGNNTMLEFSVLRPGENTNYYATLWIMSTKLFDEIESKRPQAKPIISNNGF
jgi:hypothetical protein